MWCFPYSPLFNFGQDKTCQDFKIGNFEFANPLYSDWKITRTDSTQIETNSKTGLVIQSDIKWSSACKYVLICKTISNPKLQKAIGKVFEVEIIETFTDRYICLSKSNEVQPEDLKLEMVKVD